MDNQTSSKIEFSSNGVYEAIQFKQLEHSVRLHINPHLGITKEEIRNILGTIEGKYSELASQIFQALFEFWEKHRESDKDYCHSIPEVNNSQAMSKLLTLYMIEIGPEKNNIGLLYEFGSHSEYILAVKLENYSIQGVAFA